MKNWRALLAGLLLGCTMAGASGAASGVLAPVLADKAPAAQAPSNGRVQAPALSRN